jgi:ABC-2 type transport system ATP-binding protein
MVSVRNVTKHYGNFLALDDVTFDVAKGEITAFLGPNGAGKTTTMRILTGFMPPDSGEIEIDGKDVFEERESVKAIIGYLPENPPLYPELTVTEYLTFVAELKRVPKKNVKEAVERAIEATDLKERRDTLLAYLSKGFKQRAGIAQAIVHDPKVLVLDEPTIGLDPLQVLDIRALVRKLAGEERTIILSTHMLAEASEICTKAVIINNGKIVAVDRISALKAKLTGGSRIGVKVLQSPEAAENAVRSLSGVRAVARDGSKITVTADEDIRDRVAKAVVDSGAGLVELGLEHGSLEDVFVQLVQ